MDDPVYLHVMIPANLNRQVEEAAARRGDTLDHFVAAALYRAVDKNSDEPPADPTSWPCDDAETKENPCHHEGDRGAYPCGRSDPERDDRPTRAQ